MKTLYRFQHEGAGFLLNGGHLLAFQPNLQLLKPALNISKSDRCTKCWKKAA